MVMSPSYLLEKRRDAHELFSYFRKNYNKRCHDIWLTVTVNTQSKLFKDFTDGTGNLEGLKHKPAEVEIWYERVIKAPIMDLCGCRKNDGEGIFGKVLGYFVATEFQGNGLPHLHMLIWLENRDLLETGAFISTEEIPE